MPGLLPRRRDERGAVAILFAVCTVLLFVLAAMVVDLGLARDTRRESQNAADASALAAANRLYLAGGSADLVAAANEAKSYAATNFGVSSSAWNSGSCVDPYHLAVLATGTECISFNHATNPTVVRVRIPDRVIGTGLGRVAGVNEIPVASVAEAGVGAAIDFNCALCFLNSIDAGNGDFTVEGGGIQVNGNIQAQPNSIWSAAGPIGASGTVSGGQYNPGLANPKPPGFTDPLAGMALPTLTGTAFPSVHSCTTSINPGIYSTLSLGNNDTCTLNPGKYVIVGRWLLGNKSVLQGNGVTLYYTCGTVASPHVCTSADSAGGWLDGKNGSVALSAGASGSIDYAIIYDRQNPEDLGLQGNGGTSITGGVYAANGNLDFNGNSCFGFAKGPIVVNGVIKANGNGSCVEVKQAVDLTATSRPGAIALSK